MKEALYESISGSEMPLETKLCEWNAKGIFKIDLIVVQPPLVWSAPARWVDLPQWRADNQTHPPCGSHPPLTSGGCPARWAGVDFPRVSNLHLSTSVWYPSIWSGWNNSFHIYCNAVLPPLHRDWILLRLREWKTVSEKFAADKLFLEATWLSGFA